MIYIAYVRRSSIPIRTYRCYVMMCCVYYVIQVCDTRVSIGAHDTRHVCVCVCDVMLTTTTRRRCARVCCIG